MDKPSGWAVWFTGLPASGTTTLARAFRHRLRACGISSILLDSDELRRLIMPDAASASAECDRLYDRLVELAAWLACAGENVIIAAPGDQRRHRAAARARLAPRFAEVWVHCPAAVRRARDSKRRSAQAGAGLIHGQPGAGMPYEAPEAAEFVVDIDRLTPETAAELVLAAIPFLQPAGGILV